MLRKILLVLSVFVISCGFVGATAFTVEIVGHLQEGTDP